MEPKHNLRQRAKFGQKVLLVAIVALAVLFLVLGILTNFSLETTKTP